jgi:hypothetical protein
MELRSFIAHSIVDIYHGILDAQNELPKGVVVPPVASNYDSVKTGIHEIQTIKFEVVVKVEEQKGKSAKINVVTGFLAGGMAEKSGTDSGHSGSLQFAVPVRLPVSRPEKKND